MNATAPSVQLILDAEFPLVILSSEADIRDRCVKKIIQFAWEHIAQPIRLQGLADLVELSPRQLSRLFTSEIKQSPMHYVHRLRLEYACYFLVYSRLTVKEICLEIGWENEANFRNEFKKRKGYPPCEFRYRERSENRVHF